MKADSNDRRLLLQLVEAISPGANLEQTCGQAGIDADNRLIEQLVGCPPGTRKLRLWENQNCLVTSKKIANHNWFQIATKQSADKGWPVYVRSTGGSTVVHRPGILNVSLAVVSRKALVRPKDTYTELLSLMINALGKLGVNAKSGFIEDSYCDGRYNICFNGRKIAGTASRLTRRKGKTIFLCHASITVFGSVSRDVDLVREFESHAIADCEIKSSRHVSVEAALRLS